MDLDPLVTLNIVVSGAAATVYAYAAAHSQRRGHRLLTLALIASSLVCVAFGLGYFLIALGHGTWVPANYFRPVFWLLVGAPTYTVYRLLMLLEEREEREREAAVRLLEE
jgi:MFS family permease